MGNQYRPKWQNVFICNFIHRRAAQAQATSANYYRSGKGVRVPGLPWIWISMDKSMDISMDIMLAHMLIKLTRPTLYVLSRTLTFAIFVFN